MHQIAWNGIEDRPSKIYVCGYCGERIASDKGYAGNAKTANRLAYIYICHQCQQPTFFDPDEKQYPGAAFGNAVHNIPSEDVKALYDEARNCLKVNAYTASVLCCRKLLMNIAVSEGANEGNRFIAYVDYLADNGYVPVKAKPWVDHIRNKGNEATHEIPAIERQDAEDLITFIEMILRSNYEYPAKVPKP